MELIVVLLIAGAAVAAVMVPLLRTGPVHDPGLEDAAGERMPRPAAGAREAEIERYRHALRAGTVCRRCGRANPDDSRYCAECGRRLPAGRSTRARGAAA